MFLKYLLGILFFLTNLLLSAHVVAEDRALIIGINAYTANAEGKGPLEGCRTDAENMYQLIQEVWGYAPSQIKMLLDTQATRQTIFAEFDNWLIQGSQQGDRVLFYYSGHGSLLPDDNGDEEDGKDEVLCPVDSIPNNGKNVIRDDEVNSRLRKLSGRQVLVITDSCHSGTVTRSFTQSNPRMSKAKRFIYPNQPQFKPSTRGIGRPEPTHNVVEPLNNVVHYSAVSPTQLALDGGPQGGVFTNIFIRAVGNKEADSNEDGSITHAEVLNYIQQESQHYCDKTGNCAENRGHLTPQLDINPKWLSSDITAREVAPPPPTESPVHTNAIAESLPGDNNSAQLRAEMLPSTTFQLGENMQTRVSSQRPGYLFVLDIDSKGKLTMLFPNEFSKKRNQRGVLQRGQSVTIPDESYGFSFEALEPTGRGLLLALLVEEDESFVQDFYQKLQSPTRGFGVTDGFGGIKRASQVQEALQRLHQQLHQTLLGTEGVGRPIRWSMVEIDYEITR